MAAELHNDSNSQITGVKTDGYRVTRNIPLDNLQCQYYRDLVPGDIGPGGYIITQKDIDDKLYEQVGVNCASPDVSWLPNEVNQEYYLENPLIDNEGVNRPIDFNNLNVYADSSKSTFRTNGGGLVIGNDDEGEDGQLFIDDGEGGGCTGELNSCFNNGTATCEECVGGGGTSTDDNGTEGGEYTDFQYRCCGTFVSSDPFPVNSYGDACNLYDCEGNSEFGGTVYYHDDNQCVVGAGSFSGGRPHNIVYQYYDTLRDEGVSLGSQPDRYHFYPVYDRNASDSGASLYYIDKQTYELDDYTTRYDSPLLHSNYAYDKFQMGINSQGTLLYNLPTTVQIVCDDNDLPGPNNSQADATYSSQQLGGQGLVQIQSSYTNLSKKASGVRFCGVDIINAAVGDFFGESGFWKQYVVSLLLQFDWNTVSTRGGEGSYEQKLDSTNEANSTNGFGLDWWIGSESNFNQDDLESAVESLTFDSTKLKDVLFRLGFPLPPVTIGGDDNPDCTQAVRDGYRILLNDFEIFIGVGTFFADFEIPDVKVEPTMKYNIDLKKGFNLKDGNLNACDYMEFTTYPSDTTNNFQGDGIYYRGDELPEEYFEFSPNNTSSDYIRSFDCNTEFNTNLKFSKLRAVCRDGSHVILNQISEADYDTGDGLIKPENSIFNTGVDACNSKIKQNSNQELYYLADEDYRDSLGIYFYDTDNKFSDNFIKNFSEDEDDDFKQYDLQNYIKNPNGLDTDESITNALDFDEVPDTTLFHYPYLANGWYYIKQDTQLGFKTGNSDVEGMLPYWSSNNNECFSYDKCLIFDTTLDDSGLYDYRQGIYTNIDKTPFSFNQFRKNQEYKVSFMMKTKPEPGVDLNTTGIHLIGAFDRNINKDEYGTLGTTGDGNFVAYALSNYRFKTILEGGGYKHFKTTKLSSNFNSQCSKNTHYDNHFKDNGGTQYPNVDVNTYCEEIRGSFTNTEIDVWQKMEFTFKPYFETTIPGTSEHAQEIGATNGFQYNDLKLIFAPLQVGVSGFQYLAGGFVNGNPGNLEVDNNDVPFTLNGESFDNNKAINGIGGATLFDLNIGKAKIYIDEIQFTEAFDFHPDVDVRKKLDEGTSDYLLTEYHNKDIDDVKAPLKAQFYFYPRQSIDDVFSEKRYPLLEEFKFGQFYISDIDWGDGSPKEFVNNPKKLGPSQMIYHTYEKSGVFEIKATMIRTRAETYIENSIDPDKIFYDGIEGVGHNKNLTVKIFISKGVDDDFKYFGSEGFSYIPFEKSLPIIGGINQRSIYYKNLYRNLGFIDTDDGTIRLNIPYNNLFDKYKSENALLKMNNDLKDDLNTFNNYNDIQVVDVNTSADYLKTLPFPKYLEEFDLDGSGIVSNNDIDLWRDTFGRSDIADRLDLGTADIPLSLDENVMNPYYNSPNVFKNPTIVSNQIDDSDIYFDEIEEELGKSLGDVDLTNIKYYNKPKSIFELLGFQCDEFSNVDIIPLNNAERGINYSNHASPRYDNDEISSPLNVYSVTKVVDSYNDTSGNPPRVGYRFKVNENGEGFHNFNGIETPFLKHGEEYTFSVHIYNPNGNTNQGENQDFKLRVKQTPTNTDWASTVDFINHPYCCTEEDFNNDGCSGMTQYHAEGWSYFEGCFYNDNGVMSSNGEIPYGMDYITLDSVSQDNTNEWQRLSGTFTPSNPNLYGEFISLQVYPEKNSSTNIGLGVGFDEDFFFTRMLTPPILIDGEIVPHPNNTFIWPGPNLQINNENIPSEIISISSQVTPFETAVAYRDANGEWDGDLLYVYPEGLTEGVEYTFSVMSAFQWPLLEEIGAGLPSPENITDDYYYVWGAQLQKGNELFDFVTEDIDLGDCLERHSGIPTHERYWKNIIPKDYSIFNREGLPNFPQYIEEFDINGDGFVDSLDSIQWINVGRPDIAEWITNGVTGQTEEYLNLTNGNGLEQPIENFSNAPKRIDTYSEQEWLDNYYYPVLPRYGQDGKFIEGDFSNNKIPYPLEAPITNEQETDKNLIINIDSFKESDNEFINDKSGKNNSGFIVSDYKQNFNNKTFETDKTRFMKKIKNNREKGAF